MPSWSFTASIRESVSPSLGVPTTVKLPKGAKAASATATVGALATVSAVPRLGRPRSSV
jgi:hypothetical protein